MTMREFPSYFKTILFGVFLVVLPLIYGNFNHIFRNEIIYCATLLFLCVFVILSESRFLALKNCRDYSVNPNILKIQVQIKGLDFAILLFLLYGILNIIFVKNGEIDRFVIYKWAAVALCYFVIKHLNYKQILLYSLAVSGVVQSIIAFLQKTGILAGNNIMFDICGSFGNPGQLGGYLAVCVVVSICLLINNIKNRNKLLTCFLPVSLIIQFFALYLADSRAAWVGLTVGLAIFLMPAIKKHKKRFAGIITILIIAMVVALYYYRPASANGRLLIWRVSAEMIAAKPFFGHGVGAFAEKYMLYQAGYFSVNPNSVFVSVADNAPFPFNEFLNVTIQQGIIGLLLLLAVFYMTFHSPGNRIFKAMLAALLAFSMFSYPVEIFPLLLLFAVCLGALKTPVSTDKNRIKPALVVCFCIVACYFSMRNIIFLNCLSSNPFDSGHYEKMRYNRTYHDYYMDWLIAHPDSEVSGRLENILPSCENYCFLGEYLISEKNYEKAATTLHTAVDMIPARIRPKYQLWQLYVQTGNMPAAFDMAQKIIETPVKVESIYTLKVKAQMRKQLEEKNRQ